MQYITPGDNWTEWQADHPDADEPTRFAALKECIWQTAHSAVHAGEIGTFWSPTDRAAWANKKLALLGITSRIGDVQNVYTLEVPASGKLSWTVFAADRVEALEEFHRKTQVLTSCAIANPDITADPEFVSGPDDPDGIAVDINAPQTTDALLDAFREQVMLAVLAGPKICESGANDVMEDYGLPHIPERRRITIARPVTGTMTTVVEAYDEASALRVAGWRWNDGHAGFSAGKLDEAGDLEVDVRS